MGNNYYYAIFLFLSNLQQSMQRHYRTQHEGIRKPRKVHVTIALDYFNF